jgi:hypothetical protein
MASKILASKLLASHNFGVKECLRIEDIGSEKKAWFIGLFGGRKKFVCVTLRHFCVSAWLESRYLVFKGAADWRKVWLWKGKNNVWSFKPFSLTLTKLSSNKLQCSRLSHIFILVSHFRGCYLTIILLTDVYDTLAYYKTLPIVCISLLWVESFEVSCNITHL